MATATFEVATYHYYDWSSRATGKTNLILKGVGGRSAMCGLSKTRPPASRRQLRAGRTPSSSITTHSQLDHLIDMLRNEKPVTVLFDNDNGLENSRISTTDEPAGEGEII